METKTRNVTEKRLAANCAAAQKLTGPKTAEGKQRAVGAGFSPASVPSPSQIVEAGFSPANAAAPTKKRGTNPKNSNAPLESTDGEPLVTTRLGITGASLLAEPAPPPSPVPSASYS
ncbi:MAG TPA: hypothetical protein VMX16_17760 [Terriglobia bacterium]|nr:hypothetical protein [Terriglobia bacterium]